MTRTFCSRTARCLPTLVLSISIVACGSGDSTDNAATEARRAELATLSGTYAEAVASDLQANPEAMQLAADLFTLECGGCHGADASGDRGVTDLTRGHFDYGATEDAIRTTIREGRRSEMPGMGREYGEVELGQIVAYLDTLITDAPLNDYETRGQEFYVATCVACHGEDGRGITAVGGSDLTDDYWAHGDSMMNKRLVITRGATSECPPGLESLSSAEVELLTAWVMNLIES